ncbi:MAG: double-strand break repair helicase AddA [Geminicoccaceae bacterium]
MSQAPTPAHGPTPAQRRAADPAHSVWVTANAGTGKTRVLSDRVLRLLLAGAEPEGILCLTFTKAAAIEMTTRVEARLAEWATAAEDRLAAELEALTGAAPARPLLDRARRLFAQVLELPRGLGIMTIHALCGSLLRRFPLEAGVAPHFETIDERTAGEMLEEARERMLGAAQREGGPLGRALDILAVTLGESSLTEALAELLGQRVRLLRARAAAGGGTDALIAAIYRGFDAKPGREPALLEQAACADGVYDADGLQAAVRALALGSDKDDERGRMIATWLSSAPGDRARLLADYRRCFLKVDGGPLKSLGTKKALQDERAARALLAEQARLLRLADAIKGLLIARRTEALLRVAFAMIDAYERLKEHAAALDYDDLIERTRELLHRPGKTEWVLYKLDARVDHVLVDEAQDTSPAQWAIIEKLAEEFFAGAGARAVARTLFVVGDEKQSIYSFQGADLANFRRVKELMAARAEAAGRPILPEILDRSFRSVPAVLDLVDAVFALPEARAGVADQGTEVRHVTERAHEAGLVELWPLARPAELGPAEEPWPLPDVPRVSDEPERRVARAIARTVRGWLTDGERLASTGRLMRAGDVLVLVTRRGTVQELVIRALKQAGVPVAGADRLSLREHIAVRDLIACGRALLLPEDDLNLACLLKSPLLGLSEEDLFALAWERGEASLLERLRQAAQTGPARMTVAYERLRGWLQRADFMPPFEFFTWMLGADGGRQRLLARLGPDAIEPIEAFLGQTLAYEQGHPTSLEGFLHWICLGADELKRDPEKARDVVRVTTVHGAKGLEAPVVILADAGPRGQPRSGRLLWRPAAAGAPELPLWRPRQEDREGLTQALVEAEVRRELEERRRLLYVALTRARDRLYVTGWLPRRAAKAQATEGEVAAGGEPSWHELVRQALLGSAATEKVAVELGLGLTGEALRLCRGLPAAEQAQVDAPPAAAPPALPAWIAREPVAEPAAIRPAAASALASEPSLPSPLEAGLDQRRRGILIHRLLQRLPELAADERPAAARQLLAGLEPRLAADERDGLAAAVVGLIGRPELAVLFGPGSRAEQPVAGTVAGQPIIGQIDRMALTREAVLIVDYKSGRPPPARAEAAPPSYLRQLAAYRALLQAIYPGLRVEAGLLWTEGPRLDWLPAALLDRHAPGSADPAAA